MPEYHEISSLHKEEYGDEPSVVIRVPGVVNLMGEHTESSEGFVLSMALECSALIALSERADNSLRFFAAQGQERKRTTLANLKYKREDRWANYPKGVLASLSSQGYDLKGLNWTLISDIPPEVGLGSSAALCVGTALGVKELFGFDIADGQLVETARQAESSFIQCSPYISDALSCYFAQKGSLLLLDTRSLDYQQITLPESLLFLVTDTRVPPLYSDEDFPEYAESREDCLSVLRKRRPGLTLRDYNRDDLREDMSDFSEISRRRCLHVIQENQRVLEMKKSLKDQRWAQAGKLMYHSHESLRDLYEISCPELDWLVKRAQETEGVWGARMAGPGFGGCTVTMLSPSALGAFESHLEDYDRIFGFKADHFIGRPAAGAHRIHPD